MASIEAKIDRAVAVLAILSTASVVPSPTRLPKPTVAPPSGGSTSRSNSALSAKRRRRSEEATPSRSGFEVNKGTLVDKPRRPVAQLETTVLRPPRAACEPGLDLSRRP